jgi:hypothetical protein
MMINKKETLTFMGLRGDAGIGGGGETTEGETGAAEESHAAVSIRDDRSMLRRDVPKREFFLVSIREESRGSTRARRTDTTRPARGTGRESADNFGEKAPSVCASISAAVIQTSTARRSRSGGTL